MNREQITEALRVNSVEIVELCKGLEAQHKVFAAAAFAQDSASMDTARGLIVALTDRQLDNIASSMVLSKRLMLLTD